MPRLPGMNDALVLHVANETVFFELERNPGFGGRIIAALSAKLHASVRELALEGLVEVRGRKVGFRAQAGCATGRAGRLSTRQVFRGRPNVRRRSTR